MNREIKFRGKPCYKGVKTWPWIYGTFQYIAQRLVNPGGTDNGTLVPRVDKGRIVDLYGNKTEVLCDTVGQFTGLYDKNGKEIYEGDIVTLPFQDIAFGIITWHNNGYFFIDTSNAEWRRFSNDFFTLGEVMNMSNECKVKVIGNIHDNPELLK